MADGTWAAGVVGRLDVLTDVAYGPTPWEASAAVYEALGEDIQAEWETLPWTTLRLAHGITEGVTSVLGASFEARRAIDAANYEEEMRELGVSEYVTLTAEKRATLAGAAAERFVDSYFYPGEHDVERALHWDRVANASLGGYEEAIGLLCRALDTERLSEAWCILVRQASEATVAANTRNDIAPDSR